MGLGKGQGQELSLGGEVDDNSLSPEACYECKINGYPKRGRKRRSTNETANEAEVIDPFWGERSCESQSQEAVCQETIPREKRPPHTEQSKELVLDVK